MEGQKFTVCVHWRRRQQQSLLAGQGGRGEEVVCEERRERARDARGKEGLWAGGGARWRSMAGDRRRQMSGGGETEVGRNSSPKKKKRRWWGGKQYRRECSWCSESSAQFYLSKITFESPYKT